LASGATRTFTLTVRVDLNTPGGTVISNTATVSSSTHDPNTNNNSDTETTGVISGRTVTKTADTQDGVCDADCSLREAIAASSSGDTIQFNIPATDAGCSGNICTINLTLGTLDINKDLTIDGTGANNLIVRRADNAFQFSIFTVRQNVNATILDMTITNGNSPFRGGAIDKQRGGSLTLTNVVISGNTAAYYGGGIFTEAPTTLNTSTVTGNHAGYAGGGIFLNQTSLILNNSTVTGNTSGFVSPNIHLYGSSCTGCP
jgi:CSLREA domain-containing protein